MKNGTLIVPLNVSDETIHFICSSFEEKLSEQIDFRITKRAELIGGFVAKIDGTTYDNSVASGLARMKKHLMKK